MNTILIVLAFRDHNLFDGTEVFFANGYLEIVCVLLATIWCTGTSWDSAASEPTKGTTAVVLGPLTYQSESLDKNRSPCDLSS